MSAIGSGMRHGEGGKLELGQHSVDGRSRYLRAARISVTGHKVTESFSRQIRFRTKFPGQLRSGNSLQHLFAVVWQQDRLAASLTDDIAGESMSSADRKPFGWEPRRSQGSPERENDDACQYSSTFESRDAILRPGYGYATANPSLTYQSGN